MNLINHLNTLFKNIFLQYIGDSKFCKESQLDLLAVLQNEMIKLLRMK